MDRGYNSIVTVIVIAMNGVSECGFSGRAVRGPCAFAHGVGCTGLGESGFSGMWLALHAPYRAVSPILARY